ncbi:hypothetical protein HNV10_12610 [Winogradskyella litoriviva]|uniref:Uncharacterized protein n=1 Tax=Winogradskyella litoriviva TaxID=1220182 RepID=A0ABX2E8K5_9FLAO|nr:hypothetical protein [Winogradskyella litoriviva]NRD24094.1 hypothetical protein [Winogradskyella litoriviva]
MKQFRLLLFLLIIATTSVSLSQTVYTTKTGEKYHKASCAYLKYSKKPITLDKAKALGYVACKVCKPTKAKTSNKSNEPNSLSATTKKKETSKKTTATQCIGKTQAGKRCKRKTKNANGRCYQH